MEQIINKLVSFSQICVLITMSSILILSLITTFALVIATTYGGFIIING